MHCAQYFVHSSLSPVLLFRRRLKSVADVLHGIRSKGFTQTRWGALLRYWSAVCRHGPCGPITSLHPWDDWIPPDLHGFFKWVFDSLDALNGFLRQVVVSRRDDRIHRWTWWLREDLSSRHYVWLRPDFVPPSPFLVVNDPQTQSSRILVEPHLIDAEFRKAWMPFFCRSGHLVVTPDQFLGFGGHLLPEEPYLELPRISGRDLQEVARVKKSTAGGLDGLAWNEIKALPLPWFSGLAILLELVRVDYWSLASGLLDAYITMIPKADGDSTPPGQRPLSVLPVVYRLWASLRLGHLREWVEEWLPKSVFSQQWKPGSLLLWILRRFFLGRVVISCMSWLLMSLSPLMLLIGLFWIVFWVAWDCLTGFVKFIFLFIVRFVFGSSLLLDLVNHGAEMVVFTKAVL